MKRLFTTAVALGALCGALGTTFAQGVRSQGMAGLVLPGPGAAYLNPAYAAFPSGKYGSDGGFTLPIGLLGLLRPEANPLPLLGNPRGFSQSSFDLLTFYDQFSYLNQFLINPARSPDEVIINLNAPVSVTDGSGRPLNLNFSVGNSGGVGGAKALTPEPLFRIPISVIPGLSLDFGLFAGGLGYSLSPDANLRRVIAGGALEANTAYGVDGRATAQAGVSASVAYATPLPAVPIPDLGDATVYVGGRGEAFYGLAYVEAEGKAAVVTDANRTPSSSSTFSGKIFYSYPGQGSGFGMRADAGVVFDTKVQGRDVTVGLGIRNVLGFARWTGREIVQPPSGSSTEAAAERTSFGFVPAFYLNGATRVPLETGEVVAGADLGFDGGVFGRVGAEYLIGPARVRAGLGYKGGFVFGLGAGFSGPGFSADTALTTHPGPVVGGTVFGIALSLGFGF